MNWIKLTAQQATEISALSASNPTSNYVRPRLDNAGASWLSAGVLNSGPTFTHYGAVLSKLVPTHANPPVWPASPL